jgi:hypothetical protein
MTTYSGTVAISGYLQDNQGGSASFAGTLQDSLVATLDGSGSGTAYETVSGNIIATPNDGSGPQDIPFNFTTPSFQFKLGNFSENQPITEVVNGISITVNLTGNVSANRVHISETLSAPISGTYQGVTFSGAINGSALLTAPALSITGTVASQSTSDTSGLLLFRNVSIVDLDPTRSVSVTVSSSNAANGFLSNLGGGFLDASTGVYSVSGTPAAVTAALDSLVFNPTAHQPGGLVATGFSIQAKDSGGDVAADSFTSVNTTESALPLVPSFDSATRSDLVWRNANGDAGIWLSTASGGFTATDFGVVDSSWSIQAVGDFNGDKKADLLWRNTANGQVGEWLSTPGSGYTGFTAPILATIDPGWQVQGAGDFSGDGRSDILWRNISGETGIWLTTAAGHTSVDFGVIDNGWTIQGVGDFNGDAKADILWRNVDGDVGEWLSDGLGGFTTPILANIDPSWKIQGAGDFSGDGLSDILWRNINGDTGVWLTKSGGGYTVVDFGTVDLNWTIQGVGDFNGDGKADLLWRNTATGQVGEWLSKAGGGFTGFTTPILATVDPSWRLQGIPPALQSALVAAPFAHAMAAMGAASGGSSAPMVGASAAPLVLIAATAHGQA